MDGDLTYHYVRKHSNDESIVLITIRQMNE